MPAPASPPPVPALPDAFHAMVAAGALVAVSSSGGKDSQALTIVLARVVPADQLIVVHAPLRLVEWPGTIEHIRRWLPPAVPLVLAPIASGETLLDRFEKRGMFPSKHNRYCTSDYKRGPIERELRRYLKAHPRFRGRIVSAIGYRAEESSDREIKDTWQHSARNSKAGRAWFDLHPILHWSRADVFRTIRDAGQQPHWAYGAGMSRVSCSFCIFGSEADLRTAARLRPGLYRQYAGLEVRKCHTLSLSRKPLPEITGIDPAS